MLTPAEIFETINARCDELKLSQTEVCRRALGATDASAIQNIKRGSLPRIDNLKALADVLGLELYFGKKLGQPTARQSQDNADFEQMQFSEGAPSGNFGGSDQMDDYWRLPWNRFCRLDAAVYFMFHKRWVRRALGREPDHLSTVDLPDGSGIAGVGGPVTAMIDEHAERMGTSYWVWRENDGPRAGRLTWGKTTIVIEGRDGVVETRILEGAERQSIQPLGRILWVGLVLTGNAPFRESKNDE